MATLKTDYIKGSATPGSLTVGDGTDSTSLTVKGAITQQSGSNSFVTNSIDGDAIDGGTISNFASTGIDDNSTSGTAITIATDRDVSLAADVSVAGDLQVSGDITGSPDCTLGAVTVTSINASAGDVLSIRGMVEVSVTSAYSGGGTLVGTPNVVLGCWTGSGSAVGLVSQKLRLTYATASRPPDTDYTVQVTVIPTSLNDCTPVPGSLDKQTSYVDLEIAWRSGSATTGVSTVIAWVGGW